MNNLLQVLNNIALSAVNRSEIIGAFFAFAIIFMLIIPLPLGLIDFLIALNFCLSSLLIVLAMYLPSPLAFSSFPAVLLLTTMFRLALSISTTRQILIQHDGGHIVEAFGSFVVAGNLAVGLVIFMILTIVNFLVITKGSERVAEVAARFTLDAMPGKQMSIDSDLRSGILTVEHAKKKRIELARESQLFGAMDGAMKFVKGDAIAGLVILLINLIGGVSIGVLQQNMEVADSLHVYSILTIGDGLIAQIPSLLISLTAGMIITRVSSATENDDSNIGREIAVQLASQPKAWLLASSGMFAFSLLPGMPAIIFLVLALLTLSIGGFNLWRVKRNALDSMQEAVTVEQEFNGEEDLREFNPTHLYLLQFSSDHQHNPSCVEFIKDIRRLRNKIIYKYGFTLPGFEIEYSDKIAKDEFIFSVYEIPKVRGTFNSEKVAIDKTLLDEGDIYAPDIIAGTAERQEENWLWLDRAHSLLKDETLPYQSSQQLLLLRIENALHDSSPHFIGLHETHSLIKWLEFEQPELAEEIQRVISLSRFSLILQNLVAERIPLRSVREIAEAVVEHANYEEDINILVDLVRISLKDHICYTYSQDQRLDVWLLDPETEELLRDSLQQHKNDIFFQLPQNDIHTLLQQLRQHLPTIVNHSQVLLVIQELRGPLFRLIHDELQFVPVLSFSELKPYLSINVQGRIAITENIEDMGAFSD